MKEVYFPLLKLLKPTVTGHWTRDQIILYPWGSWSDKILYCRYPIAVLSTYHISCGDVFSKYNFSWCGDVFSLIFSMNKNIYVALYFLHLLKYTNDVMYLFDIFSNTHVDLFCDVFPLTLCSSGRLPPGRFTCDSWRRATSQVPQPTTSQLVRFPNPLV